MSRRYAAGSFEVHAMAMVIVYGNAAAMAKYPVCVATSSHLPVIN